MFISTGSFIIRGKRNFIQPQKLELGFTMMYCLGEESIQLHKGERKPREELKAIDEEEAGEQLPPLELSKESSSYSVSVREGEDEDI